MPAPSESMEDYEERTGRIAEALDLPRESMDEETKKFVDKLKGFSSELPSSQEEEIRVQKERLVDEMKKLQAEALAD